jgi:hypothetical protein
MSVLAHPLSWSALILMLSGDDSLMSMKAKAGFWLTLEVKIFTLFVVWCRVFFDIICGLG